MNKRELVKAAIAHQDITATPQAINLTGEGYKAYGNRLLEDYKNPQVLNDLKEGHITFEQAVSLSIMWVSMLHFHNATKKFYMCNNNALHPDI